MTDDRQRRRLPVGAEVIPGTGAHFRVWAVAWSSEDPQYGGRGTAPLERPDGWHIPGHAALVLVPESVSAAREIFDDV